MQDLLFLYILGWSSEGLFLTIAELFMCQFPGTASENFPFTVYPPAVNNGALILPPTNTRTHTHMHSCMHIHKKSAMALYFTSRNARHKLFLKAKYLAKFL